MKPFDLKEALRGKPVQLCSGAKAYVVTQLTYSTENGAKLFGYAFKKREGVVSTIPLLWTQEGACRSSEITDTHLFNITAMWETKEQRINGITVSSEPVTEETIRYGSHYYIVGLGENNGVAYTRLNDTSWVKNLLARRLVFETQEEAETMYKALMNYKKELVEVNND